MMKLSSRLFFYRMQWLFVALGVLTLSGCTKPDFYQASGEGVIKKQLQEKALVLNYWATWCAPCIAEIPELNALAVDEAARLNVLGVNFDNETDAALGKAINKMKITFPVAAGPVDQIFAVPVPQVLPTTYIFSPGGALKRTLVGPQTHASIMSVLEED